MSVTLIAGLGNPGREYAATRHNLGFTVVDALAAAEGLKWKSETRFEAETARWDVRPGVTRLLVKPTTFMNDSGRALRGLLADYSERVIALETRVRETEAVVEESQSIIREQTPKVLALDRIATATGSLCITDAAKILQVQPKVLFAWLSANAWIYQRVGSSAWLGYQDKVQSGVLEHKVTTVSRSDGSEKTVTQVRITPKGLARLSTELSQADAKVSAPRFPEL